MNPPIIDVLRKQRNDALDAAANASADNAALNQSLVSVYRLFAQTIRSGQLLPERVASILEDDPQFAAWYHSSTKNKENQQ